MIKYLIPVLLLVLLGLPLVYQSIPTEILKLKTFDALVKKQEPSGNFVILNITEQDVENEGGYPFPRQRLAEIQIELLEAGAIGVGWVIAFPHPDRTGGDAEFAEALSYAPSVLPLFETNNNLYPKTIGTVIMGEDIGGYQVQGVLNNIPILSEIPYIGPSLFSLNPLIYLAFFMVYIVWWFLFKTKQGLILRAIGDNHDAAHAIGHNVVLYRFIAILFGGAMAGLGGAFLSLVQVPIWGEGMTAGRGWIAIGLVVFASWQPFRVILGAVLFGGITVLQLHAQGFDIRISAQYLSMLPYLATIVILVSLRMRLKNKTNRTVPNCLGRIFHSTT